MSEAAPPRVFLSYAWGDPMHNERVMRLATELRASGIDVVFDRWDLQLGHDTQFFMERMISDPSIDRVLVLLNSTYVEKADARKGGVGTETLIMAPDVYANPEQVRFLPVLFGTNGGRPLLPVFLRSRLYVDLSTDERWAENLDELVANLHGLGPQKPPLGTVPLRILEAAGRRLKGKSSSDRAVPASSLLIPSRLHQVIKWHGLDLLQAAQLLAPFGFTLAALSQPERTLELLSEEVVAFLCDSFQVNRGYLLGEDESPGVMAGFWYKDVRRLCRRIVDLHNADELEAVRFVTAQGSRLVDPKAKYREALEEDVTVVLVLKRVVGAHEFVTCEVWETGTWTYEKCRVDLKAILLFCEQVHERRALLQVAGGTFTDKVFQAVRERRTHVAEVVGEGWWGRDWHPTDYVSPHDHLARDRGEMSRVLEVYARSGLEALASHVTPRPL